MEIKDLLFFLRCGVFELLEVEGKGGRDADVEFYFRCFKAYFFNDGRQRNEVAGVLSIHVGACFCKTGEFISKRFEV